MSYMLIFMLMLNGEPRISTINPLTKEECEQLQAELDADGIKSICDKEDKTI